MVGLDRFEARKTIVQKLKELNLLEKINYSEFDVVFFALPQSVSQNIIKNYIGKSVFIDLSADFRLDNSKVYKKNLNVAYTRLSPPHTPIIKNIGISTDSKKI